MVYKEPHINYCNSAYLSYSMHFRMKCCLTVFIVYSYFLTNSAQRCDTTVQRTVELPAILEFLTCRCAGDYSYTINGYDFESDRHRTFATCQAIFFATVYQSDQGNYTLKTGECEMTVCLYVNCKYIAISYTPILEYCVNFCFLHVHCIKH